MYCNKSSFQLRNGNDTENNEQILEHNADIFEEILNRILQEL